MDHTVVSGAAWAAFAMDPRSISACNSHSPSSSLFHTLLSFLIADIKLIEVPNATATMSHTADWSIFSPVNIAAH